MIRYNVVYRGKVIAHRNSRADQVLFSHAVVKTAPNGEQRVSYHAGLDMACSAAKIARVAQYEMVIPGRGAVRSPVWANVEVVELQLQHSKHNGTEIVVK